MDWHDELTVPKDPDAVLDYKWDFGPDVLPWVQSGDSISGHTVTPDSGIVVDSSALIGDIVTVWLSGGTAGESYSVTVEVVSTQGRTDHRTVVFEVVER